MPDFLFYLLSSKDNLFGSHDAEHFGAANRTSASHRPPFFPALTFHSDFFWILHIPFLFTLYTVSLYCFCHRINNLKLIIEPISDLID